MPGHLKLVDFPFKPAAVDIPTALRKLADEIEAGDYNAALSLLWVIDCGNADIRAGLMGQCSDPGGVAYLLAGVAQRKIEKGMV